jgi:flavin-binding protein dodecin
VTTGRPVSDESPKERKTIMANVVKVIEVLAQSEKSWEDAAKNALNEAKKSLRNIRSLYIKNFEAKVENDKIVEYRINAKIAFELEGERSSGS